MSAVLHRRSSSLRDSWRANSLSGDVYASDESDTVTEGWAAGAMRSPQPFDSIIGSSLALKRTLKQVAFVAPSDATVLIQGFRSDLYYRLNIVPITAPPLRERGEDVLLLAEHFADKYARRMNKRFDDFPPEGKRALAIYDWPGNVRELQNVIERAVIMSDDGVLCPEIPARLKKYEFKEI